MDNVLQNTFTDIYVNKRWGAGETVSGPGSTFAVAQSLMSALPPLFRRLNVTSILDVPCGDFNWMSHMDIGAITYTGGDIVPELVATNNTRFSRNGRAFEVIDIVTDKLPAVDLILCRDCLIHLSLEHGCSALDNFRDSGSTWLLATTFTDAKTNTDIVSGGWRTINMALPPYCLGPCAQIVKETSLDGCYLDKCLGLWRLN